MATKFKQETDFPSATLLCGDTGTGKSTKGKERIEYHHELGDCCIDLFDLGRLENAYYAFPNPYVEYYTHWQRNVSRNPLGFVPKLPEPKGFDTDIHFPAIAGVSEELPDIFKPFRIPFNELSFDEMVILIGGNLTEYGLSLLSLAWVEITKRKGPTIDDLAKEIIGYAKKGYADIDGENVPVSNMTIAMPLIRRIISLQRTNILCGRKDEYALDLHKLMRDTSRIHSFSMRYVPELEQSFLIYGWLCKRMYDLRMRHNYPEMACLIREVQNLAPQKPRFKGQSISTKYLRMIVSEGRDLGIRMFYDSQFPMKVDRDLRFLPLTYHMFRMDRIVVTEFSKMFWLHPSVRTATENYPNFKCTTRVSTQKYKVNANIFYAPPRSWCKKPREDFIGIWKSKGLPMTEYDFKRPEDVIRIKQSDDRRITKIEVNLKETRKSQIVKIIQRLCVEMKKPPSRPDLLAWVDLNKDYLYQLLTELMSEGKIESHRDKSDRRTFRYEVVELPAAKEPLEPRSPDVG